jgi:hypothetical protein
MSTELMSEISCRVENIACALPGEKAVIITGRERVPATMTFSPGVGQPKEKLSATKPSPAPTISLPEVRATLGKA